MLSGELSAPQRTPVFAFHLGLAAVALWRVARSFAALHIGPFQQDYEEGNILNALLRITQGDTPYPDPHAFPNVINPYGPAAYYLLFLPVKIMGTGFLYPRAMIFGCALMIAALIAVELWRRTGMIVLALAFGLFFLTIPNIHYWAWLLRVDLLGIAFTVGGLVAFSRRLDRDQAPGVLPAFFFAAGLLVKPTLIAAPAACFFALIAKRRRRDATKLAAMTAGAFVLVMGFFAAVTRGAVLIDVFLSHPDPYSLHQYLGGLVRMSRQSWPLVLLASVAVGADLSRRRVSPPILWLLIATLTSATAGGLGSNLNHFLEWNAALCLAGGIGMSTLVGFRFRKVALLTTAVAVITMAFIKHPRMVGNRKAQTGCPEAYKWVQESTGPNLLAENVGALVLGHKRVWVSNPFVLAQLVEHAGWSDAELVRMVRERRFDAVLTEEDYPSVPSNRTTGVDRFSPAVLRALAENYVAEPGFQCLDMNVIFKPKPTSGAADAGSPK
jgi:hypothetical protein